MDLAPTSEQALLVRAARNFLAEACPMAHVRAMESDACGFSRELFREMGRLGWLGVALPEMFGGSGQTPLEAALLLEEMGRVLLPSPYLYTAVVVAPLVLAIGSDAQRRRWLEPIAAGDVVATLALVEPGWRQETGALGAEVRRVGDRVRIDGTKCFVPFAPQADLMLVVVREAGRAHDGRRGEDDRADTRVIAVEAGTRAVAGVKYVRRRTLGGDLLYHVGFEGALVSAAAILGPAGAEDNLAGDAAGAVAAACARAAVGALAYTVGAAERVLELTVEHARTREQFGRPIGSFQAVAHRCVDMRSDIDALRLLVYQAAWALGRSPTADLEVGAAKAYGNEALRRIFMHAHQVFGAIGFSTEHDLHLFTRRAKATELAWGSTSAHRERVAAAMGL